MLIIVAWLSLVERCVRDAEVVGSNPVASTSVRKPGNDKFPGFFVVRYRVIAELVLVKNF